MPSRSQLVARLESVSDYGAVAEEFGISPGLAYMIVTGLPADGSDVLPPEELENRYGLIGGSTQALVNPGTENPKHKPVVERWVKGRVSADAAMRKAGMERTATPPPVAAEDETDDIVSVIGWQHNQVKYLQEQLEAIPGLKKGGNETKQQQRVSIVDMMRLRLAKHETAEEECLWPAVRKYLDQGDELADKALSQEQEGNELLHELENLPGDDERFDHLVEQLTGALRKHVAHEDSVLLLFKQTVPSELRDQIGQEFRKAYGRAPTHPKGAE